MIFERLFYIVGSLASLCVLLPNETVDNLTQLLACLQSCLIFCLRLFSCPVRFHVAMSPHSRNLSNYFGGRCVIQTDKKWWAKTHIVIKRDNPLTSEIQDEKGGKIKQQEGHQLKENLAAHQKCPRKAFFRSKAPCLSRPQVFRTVFHVIWCLMFLLLL